MGLRRQLQHPPGTERNGRSGIRQLIFS